MSPDLSWQPALLDVEQAVRRHHLGAGAWVDVEPGFCREPDALFAALLALPWGPPRTVRMYDRLVPEPRLVRRWTLADAPPRLRGMADALGGRYGVRFTQIGANLYRDGADSVAWHGDRVARELPGATVALVSLGAVRPFRLRPRGGGPSTTFHPGPGDLLVMGGTCQRTWQHAVPKQPGAGPRISVQFRHAHPR
ncbi:MAG: Alkylated DNA repair protein AlkB [uncultured Pseudonocardia sp.]|uniref:Alkylated DNA repair protein AlkB n=1 Tax=uncultured Pseudonocardia sp. TaxID=211455 RepID=A0A6J4P0R1_9PSEU|nr:MAG: Alkylated DNA repair protein AlkB [uncultured Pseudonocardia sp.]